jgi:serine/alanine adding enzyme
MAYPLLPRAPTMIDMTPQVHEGGLLTETPPTAVRAPRRAPHAVSTMLGADAAWDAFVRRSPGSTFCHLSGWRHIMRDVLGHENRSMVAVDEDDGSIRGILPLVRVRSRLLGHYLISMPFLNAGGPLGTEDAVATLVKSAMDDAKRTNVDLLELRTRSALDHGLRRSDRKITVHLQLAGTQEENWKALHSKVRSQVRRAQKEGLTATFGPDQREAFYALFADNMRRLGTPVLPAALFERIATTFPKLVEFGVIRLGDVPVAAGCGFHWRNQFEITWAASSREHSRMAPNMLLYWEFFERARARGARTFDFGRCTPGSGTHMFKRQWGGKDVALPWAQWSAREVTSTPTQDRGMFRLASTCWSHLPLGVTNRVGPWIAAKLP